MISQDSFRSACSNTSVIACCLEYIYSGVAIKAKRMSTKFVLKYLFLICL